VCSKRNCIQDYIDANKKEQVEVVQVKEKFGCYDGATEILTKEGWKYFKDVTYQDKIVTLKNNKFIEYNEPSDIIAYNYEGQMYKLRTKGVNLVVTPNHNLYVAKGTYWNGYHSPPKKVERPLEFATYKKYFNKNKRFKKDGIWKGSFQKTFYLPEYKYTNYMKLHNKNRTYIKQEKQFDMNKWLNFLGWYVAEGCTGKNGKETSIACNNIDGGKERKTISYAIKSLEYPIKTTMEERSGMVFRIYNIQLGRWLRKNCGHLAPNKQVPKFIKNLPKEQIKIFLNSLYLGDGCRTKTAHTLYTVSKTLADDVQELVLKCGNVAHIKKYPPSESKNLINGRKVIGKHNVYTIRWLKRSNSHNTSDKGMAKTSFEGLIDYNGKVYCVEVPNHIIYIRRNGIPIWCGNSLRFYTNGSDHLVNGMIWLAEHCSWNICEKCGATNNITHTKGWIKTLCKECIKKTDKL
jgi:replicative DNA helicase Mcm